MARTNYDAVIADHIAGACQTAGDDDLFADVSDAAEVLGDRSDWSGFNGRDSLTDREWTALERAADRWIAAKEPTMSTSPVSVPEFTVSATDRVGATEPGHWIGGPVGAVPPAASKAFVAVCADVANGDRRQGRARIPGFGPVIIRRA